MNPIGAAPAAAQGANQQNGLDDQSQKAAQSFMGTIQMMVLKEVQKVGQENAG